MTFKLGLIGLCTSHPEGWVPIIRQMTAEGIVDVEIVAAWDSGETRPDGFAAEFCSQFDIPYAVKSPEEMLPLVDGVIVHTANWDKHIEQAWPFVDGGKSVLIDKPVVGNLADANIFLGWMKEGRRVTGGSSLRFCLELQDFLAIPIEERGEVHTAYIAIGVDDFNYGIHAYSMASALMGDGVQSAKFIGSGKQKQILLTWGSGKTVILTVGKSAWLPFNVTAVTDKNVFQIKVDNSRIYRSLLEAELPFLSGKNDETPLPAGSILEPELVALAARTSWLNHGQQVFVSDLRVDDPGYDGTAFAREYRNARLPFK